MDKAKSSGRGLDLLVIPSIIKLKNSHTITSVSHTTASGYQPSRTAKNPPPLPPPHAHNRTETGKMPRGNLDNDS